VTWSQSYRRACSAAPRPRSRTIVGADSVSSTSRATPAGTPSRLHEVGLEAGGYHLVVARFEPENHVAEVVEGYVASAARLPLVVVGSAPYAAEYTARIRRAADDRVQFLGGVWDNELLDQLYAGAYVYWHGHSVGGTNPSLLRAIGAGTASAAYDVGFNREVLRESGQYWSDPAGVARLVDETESAPTMVRERGLGAAEQARRYDWDQVTDEYERLCADLASGHTSRSTTAADDTSLATETSVAKTSVIEMTVVPVESR
jgi:hypothetical protein